MPDKLSDFRAEYDPMVAALKTKRASAEKALMEFPTAFTYFKKHGLASIYLSTKPNTTLKVLIGIKNILGETIPPLAEFRGFTRTKDEGFYRVDTTQTLIASTPTDGDTTQNAPSVFTASEYYNGKSRQATNGAITFPCTITIDEGTWREVERMGANIGIKQIIGILQQDPILISQKSKQMGVRCIKPEPYGWIFSTSVTTRLVAKNAKPWDLNPSALTFSAVESGH